MAVWLYLHEVFGGVTMFTRNFVVTVVAGHGSQFARCTRGVYAASRSPLRIPRFHFHLTAPHNSFEERCGADSSCIYIVRNLTNSPS